MYIFEIYCINVYIYIYIFTPGPEAGPEAERGNSIRMYYPVIVVIRIHVYISNPYPYTCI